MRFNHQSSRVTRALMAMAMAGAALAHAQNAPPPPPPAHAFPLASTPPQLPLLAHEQSPVAWPVADYFTQALAMTGMAPAPRASTLRLRVSPSNPPPYLVLPVQGQAFGFSPQFRALAGALLDRHLENAGVRATQQTDITDANGPFVRRFGEERIDAFAVEYPKRTTIALYLGHDGIGQMFITLVAREGGQRKTAHRTVTLPADAELAADQIAAALPSLVKEVGVPVRPVATVPPAKPTTCDARVWSLAPPSAGASAADRACHAIAVAMLLPTYDSNPRADSASEEVSPAKLAWLARAYTLATHETLEPGTAAAIRQLARKALGFAKEMPRGLQPQPQLSDPVVQRLIKFEQLEAATQMAPVRSAREAQVRQIESMVRDLPPFAAALFNARNEFAEPFSKVDLCVIERLLPMTMPRAACRDGGPVVAPARAPWPEEVLMYQEWRLASHHKELRYVALTQGSRTLANDTLSRLPQDVSHHPYIQRLRYVVSNRWTASGSFEDQLKAARESSAAVTQTSVDLQRADRWLASYSLTGHMWTSNLNILNDPQVIETAHREMRLLSVLRFDRFALDRYLAPRQPGETAFFLASPMWLHMSSGGMPGLVVSVDRPSDNSMPPLPLPLKKIPLFASPMTLFDGQTDADLRRSLAEKPADLHTRVILALGQLQDGGSMADALKLIDAQPTDQRTDTRIRQSHAWAEPAHFFYFAGEPGAARKYYQKVAEIGTGSESDMMARTRVKLIDGELREALRSTTARVERYDSDFARRDQAGLMFMFGQRDKAWDTFMSRASATDLFQLWIGAYTGHRMERANADQVNAWMLSSQLDRAQIDLTDASHLYRHLLAVLDRLPTETDVRRLDKSLVASRYASPFASASAGLFRSALLDTGFGNAQRDATRALETSGNRPSYSFMQPLYAWAAWEASAGKDNFLPQVRATTTRSGFDEMLAKSMVLALDGDTKESLRFYTAARFQLASVGDRWVPGPYSYALAGFLMHRRTGEDAYRQETMRFVRSQQAVFPYYGWLYAMEAFFERDPKKRHTAACRARFLDPESYFLGLARVTGLDDASCKASLSSLLR